MLLPSTYRNVLVCVCVKEKDTQVLNSKFMHITFHIIRFDPLHMVEFWGLVFVDLNSIKYGIWSTPKILLKCKFDKHFFITSSKFLTKKKRSGQDRALWLASRD